MIGAKITVEEIDLAVQHDEESDHAVGMEIEEDLTTVVEETLAVIATLVVEALMIADVVVLHVPTTKLTTKLILLLPRNNGVNGNLLLLLNEKQRADNVRLMI